MIWVCPKDSTIIVDDEWMPGEPLKCPCCRTQYVCDFGVAYD